MPHRLLFERSIGEVDLSLGCDSLWVECGLLDRLVAFRDGLVQYAVRTLVAGPSLTLPERLVVTAAPLTVSIAGIVGAPLPASALDDALAAAADGSVPLPISRVKINVFVGQFDADSWPFPFSVGEVLLRQVFGVWGELLLHCLRNLLRLGFVSSWVLRREVG